MTGRRKPFDKIDTRLHGSRAASRKRNRQWEKQHQSRKVVYRGIDPTLALQVKRIAGALQVSTGAVASAVLAYALRAHARGDFDLHPRPHPERRRMTLFPRTDFGHVMGGRPRAPRPKRLEAAWRVSTTWRDFSPDLKQELAALAGDEGLQVPIGELLTALLRFGLAAYDAGWLKLELQPKSTAAALTRTGQ